MRSLLAGVISRARAQYLHSRGVRWKSRPRVNGGVRLRISRKGAIQLGRRVVITSDWRYNDLGVGSPTTLIALGPDATIIIGDDTGISGASISAMSEILIGERVLIGSGVVITDNDHHPLVMDAPATRRYSGKTGVAVDAIRVENDVFIGAHSIVLKGVTIGEGSVIGAGSVVTTSIPGNCVAAGNPCRVIRTFTAESESRGD